jgi:acetolactate decarboxylase
VLLIATLSIVFPRKVQQAPVSNTLLQNSTLSAFLAEVYQRETTFKVLKKYGDFGLNTLTALDGEMIGLEGKFYQIKSDGAAFTVPDSMTSSMAICWR